MFPPVFPVPENYGRIRVLVDRTHPQCRQSPCLLLQRLQRHLRPSRYLLLQDNQPGEATLVLQPCHVMCWKTLKTVRVSE